MSLDALQGARPGARARDPGLFEREVAKGTRDDVATILYTSGTTGHPKA